mmetsp:Transcript_5140/g.7884  ORF Transcript_5140/g.7884 Transcript_5140/m.7884 type:complete len:142 (+) Transcript_5140:880-1305(+)|eukprot:CAMPEP_0170484882 /NCGR_PEP_ID=MMETSP0208-20121228/4245_1 /TAXON_ID=197538 /ORGANISM="Strombidium inclinatum, Strain S3" /LENGTH=141 /DNA_ID=CAMNT_0010758339 /DNA_START=1676 /DNA_END=2101 /DNA_ORIENTATION=+
MSEDKGRNFVEPLQAMKKQESSCQSFSLQSNHSKNDGGPVDLEAIENGQETRTTLMVKNVPCKYQTNEIRSDFEKNHKNRFNKLKAPMDKQGSASEKTCRGYCFVNFRHPLYVYDFVMDKKDYRWPKYSSDKTIEIRFAVD